MAPPVASSFSTVALTDLTEGLGAVRLRNEAACQEMERSLTRQGQLTAVIARRSGGGVEVVDGLKRLQAARRLGWRELQAEVREMDLVQAMVLVFQANAGSHLVEVEEAWVVRSLYRDGHLSQPQIARLLGRHKSWVCRRLMLAEGCSRRVSKRILGWGSCRRRRRGRLRGCRAATRTPSRSSSPGGGSRRGRRRSLWTSC